MFSWGSRKRFVMGSQLYDAQETLWQDLYTASSTSKRSITMIGFQGWFAIYQYPLWPDEPCEPWLESLMKSFL